jgi:hypothetical protein
MVEETPLIAPEIEETPVTIEEEAVAESVSAEKTEEPPEEAQSAPAEPKRKPGRPSGSKNKQPAKPRAKRVVVSEAVEYAPPPPTPRWDAQHQPIPTEADAKTEMAQLMLRLLSGQATERQRRKDAQRRAWFS